MPNINSSTDLVPHDSTAAPIPGKSSKMPLRAKIGWVLSVLIMFFLVFSAAGKFAEFEGRDEMFARLGWNSQGMYYMGIIEVIIGLAFLVPQTAFIGAILLTGYLGGAIATHVRVNDPFLFPIAIGVIIWIALAMRDSRIIKLIYEDPEESNRK